MYTKNILIYGICVVKSKNQQHRNDVSAKLYSVHNFISNRDIIKPIKPITLYYYFIIPIKPYEFNNQW